MEYNRELQLIDNEYKAYLLGLFYSDGTIGSTTNNCSICLHKDDKYLLIKLQELFPFFYYRESKQEVSYIEKASKDLKLDLESHGLVCQKSLQNRFSLKFPNLREDLVHHFIRGYFDGDGSVYKQKLFNIKTEVGGVAFPFIMSLIKILYDNRITFNMTCKYIGSGLRTIDYYKLYCSSYKISKAFADYIYKDSTIHLLRKYNRFYVEVLYDTRERILCPHCNSNKTVFGGIRNNKTRITCSNCNKRSSITAQSNSNITNELDELLES